MRHLLTPRTVPARNARANLAAVLTVVVLHIRVYLKCAGRRLALGHLYSTILFFLWNSN
jgi:hypothetical protein